jgi:ribosomal-protein-alanine N-acetyltransferase
MDEFRIETPRLRLVLPRPGDLVSLHALRNLPGDHPPTRATETFEEVGRKLHTIIEDNRQGRGFSLAIRDTSDDHLLGMIGVWRLDAAKGRGEIGYQVTAERRGEGLMGEAMAAFLPEVRRRLAGVCIEAWVRPDNLASIRLLERQGFAPTGEISTDDEGCSRYVLEPEQD